MSDNKSAIDLTPLQQEKIDQAAKDYADSGSFQEWLKLEPFGHESSFSKTKRNFKAGASYYEKECMPGQIAKAMEWISLKKLYQEIDGKWYDTFGGQVRLVAEDTAGLFQLFGNYIINKQKQDATK